MHSCHLDMAGLGVVTSSSNQSSRLMPSRCHSTPPETNVVIVTSSICSMREDSIGHEDGHVLGFACNELWGNASVLRSVFSLNILSSLSRDFVTSCSLLRSQSESLAQSCSLSSSSFRSLILLSRDWIQCHHCSSAMSSMSQDSWPGLFYSLSY